MINNYYTELICFSLSLCASATRVTSDGYYLSLCSSVAINIKYKQGKCILATFTANSSALVS